MDSFLFNINGAPSPPPSPRDSRPSFSRSKSHHTLHDPTRHFNTISTPTRPHPPLQLDIRPPASMPAKPAGALLSPATVNATTASAFATLQKVYHSKDDIGFWSTLYAQHHIHTRQDYQGQDVTSVPHSPTIQDTIKTHIKVWQVLTKTILDTITNSTHLHQTFQRQHHRQHPQYHFERLPIKVQTSASALSPHGQPFSIVFFFTVESTPTTLWYLESAFTQSATVHEHMELMGTFQPNDSKDPMSFYIYETNVFDVHQPFHEDTMLNIHVQSPSGTIYAEFSYTFIKENRSGTASTVSSSISVAHSPQPEMSSSSSSNSSSSNNSSSSKNSNSNDISSVIIQQKSQEQPLESHPIYSDSFSPTLNKSTPASPPLDTYDVVDRDSPTSIECFPQQHQYQHQSQHAQENPSLEGKEYITQSSPQPNTSVSQSSTYTSMTTPIRSNLEENSGDEDDCQELVAESFVEEPDAGEHFMQATSEFFSKMGYWLYNSRVVQYIARDERVRVKTVFQTEDIWILGVCYTLESNEPTCSLPETSRSRKLSSLQQQHSSRIGDSRNHTIGSLGAGSDNHRDSKRPWERKMAYSSTSPRAMTDNDSIFTFTSTAEGSESGFSRLRSREQHPERQREKELAKARKMAKELEKEEKAREKAKEKAKLKEEEKHQRLKAKISQPRFDPNNLREGTKDLSEVLTSDTKDQLHPQFRTETNRKSRSIHGYNHEEMSNVGLGLTTPSGEPKQSVIRRMRSISILQKTPSAVDALAQKKFVHDSQFGVLPDRTNQPRSQSISNISVLSQRSTGTSSLSSHDGQSRRRPTSPSPPSSVKKPLSVHEALAACPRPNVLSKLSHLNLDKKKLPDLPPLGLDDIPDIPIHPYQDPSQPERDDLTSNVHTYASVPIPDVPDTDTTEPTPTSSKDSKSGKRRMTISGIFSKDPKPSTTGGLAVLKTLVNASKISLRPKAEDPTPISRHQSPASIGTATATISFVPQPPGSSSSKKGGVTKNMQHWIERRISSNNLHQQAFVASTNEPVPLISKDVVLPPTSSPLTMRVSEANTLTQASERQQENDSQHLPSRMRKKSSIFSITSTSSAISSPLSVFKSGSPQSASSTKTFSTMYPLAEPLSIEQHNIGEAHIAFAPAPPPPQNSTSLSEVKIDKDTAPEPKLDCKVREEPDWMVPSTALDYSTSKDLVILPPLPPEPPSEAFILLNNRASSSAVSLERDLEGSVLISMPEAEEASCATASDASIQKKLLNKDIIRTENNCLFDQLAAFSNDKSESISDLRSEWESLWPSKSEANQVAGMDTVDFVHVQKTHGKRSSHLKDESLTPQERERIRKIGSTYVKVKNPTPEIVAPQPKAPLLLQSQVLHNHDSGEVPRSSSPEVLKDSPGEKSSPLSDRLLRPFTLITALPPQVSPPSPSPSLSKSWRAMSPRPHSPAFSLPFLSSSKPASSRSVRVQASSSITNKEDITGDDENASVEIDIAPRKAVSPSTLQSPTAYLSLDKPVSSSNLSTNQRTLQRFMLDFQSKFWFTYRKDIARIDPSYFTSDAGWGCMMRTGQSLLAQAFAIVLLGREWRAYPTVAEENTQKYRTLLSWFADEPEQPYSIHNIAKAGLYLDKRVGEWFGPSTVAHALKRLSEQHIDCPLHVMVSMENTVRFSDILKLATEGQSVNALAGPTRSQWKPVVILMPSRFGREKLIDRYVGNLKQLFKLPQFLGIAGGRPGRSLYFIASQGNDLFYLDPHFVKPRATYEELLNVPSTSYHCGVVRAMDIMEMDPSMMLGFLIRSTRDLLDLSTRLKNEMESGLPLLTLLEDIPLDIQDEDCQESDNQNIVSAEVQPHPKSHDESADKVLGGQSDPEYIPGLNNGHPSETQLLYGHKSGMSRIIDTSTETYKAQASMLPKQDPSETHLQQDHSSLQPKREMKRITRTLKSPMPVAKSIDGGITSRRATELYQHQRTIQNGNHMHDDDNLSVHSFDSDVSIA